MRTGCPMRIVTVFPHQKQLGKGHSGGVSRKAKHRLEIIDWYNSESSGHTSTAGTGASRSMGLPGLRTGQADQRG